MSFSVLRYASLRFSTSRSHHLRLFSRGARLREPSLFVVSLEVPPMAKKQPYCSKALEFQNGSFLKAQIRRRSWNHWENLMLRTREDYQPRREFTMGQGRRRFPETRNQNPLEKFERELDSITKRIFGRTFGILGIFLVANLLVFLLWNTYGRSPSGSRFMRANFQTSLTNIKQGRIWCLLTSCFSQSELFHLLANMLVLYYLGGGVLRSLGPQRFVTIYFLGGISSSLLHVYYENVISPKINQRQSPKHFRLPPGYRLQQDLPAHGASGSVMALSVVFGGLFPWSSLYIYGILPVPAIICVGGLIAYDLYSSLVPRRGKVSHAGHLGGALFGAVYYLNLRSGVLKRIFRK